MNATGQIKYWGAIPFEAKITKNNIATDVNESIFFVTSSKMIKK